MTGEKKTEQVGFKVTPEQYEVLVRAAFVEHRKRNELARLIWEWALDRYREAGSYQALIEWRPPAGKKREPF